MGTMNSITINIYKDCLYFRGKLDSILSIVTKIEKVKVEQSLTSKLYHDIVFTMLKDEVKRMKQSDLIRVRQAVAKHVGSKVRIKSNKGRHKVDITEGIIAETYPSIFLVQVDNALEATTRKVSFSYTDVLTKDVRLTLCN